MQSNRWPAASPAARICKPEPAIRNRDPLPAHAGNLTRITQANFVDRFRAHLQKSQLIPAGTRALVGYSGGADSTCLLHLLAEIDLDIVAAHLHHGQRAEADSELRHCEAFATSLSVPFAAGHADVPAMSRDLKLGLEDAGRRARYAFFEQAAGRLECELIVTAHTRDDQVETILLHAVRGSGLSGLAGIPDRRENIVRPLLPFGRGETRAYCEERGLWFFDDPANIDLDFARARVRHRVMPELRAINPDADRALVRLGVIAAEEDRFLNGAAASALEQSEHRMNGELYFLTKDVEVCFSRDALSRMPSVLFRRCARLAAQALGARLDYDQVQLLELSVAADGKGSLTAEGGTAVVEWNAQHIHFRLLTHTEPFRFPLTVPGETLSEELGWKFTAYESEASFERPDRGAFQIEIDGARTKGPFYFRTAEPGDDMQPVGFAGRRKVADLLSEAKLTLAARKRLPIVCDLIGPLWAPGVCFDERVRASGHSSRILRIEFGPA